MKLTDTGKFIMWLGSRHPEVTVVDIATLVTILETQGFVTESNIQEQLRKHDGLAPNDISLGWKIPFD